jgi:hypothetical protein
VENSLKLEDENGFVLVNPWLISVNIFMFVSRWAHIITKPEVKGGRSNGGDDKSYMIIKDYLVVALYS